MEGLKATILAGIPVPVTGYLSRFFQAQGIAGIARCELQMCFATLISATELFRRLPLFYTWDFTQPPLPSGNTEQFLFCTHEAESIDPNGQHPREDSGFGFFHAVGHAGRVVRKSRGWMEEYFIRSSILSTLWHYWALVSNPSWISGCRWSLRLRERGTCPWLILFQLFDNSSCPLSSSLSPCAVSGFCAIKPQLVVHQGKCAEIQAFAQIKPPSLPTTH